MTLTSKTCPWWLSSLMTQESFSIDTKQDLRPMCKEKLRRPSRRWELSSCFQLSVSSSQPTRFHLAHTWRTLRKCTRKQLIQSLVDFSWNTPCKMISSLNSSVRKKGSRKGSAILRSMKSTKGWKRKQISRPNSSEKCLLITIKFYPTRELGIGW